jgi:hypothetical protein
MSARPLSVGIVLSSDPGAGEIGRNRRATAERHGPELRKEPKNETGTVDRPSPRRIAGGLLYAATSNVPWATLLARTFELDVKACARRGGWLAVRGAMSRSAISPGESSQRCRPVTARAPPSTDASVLRTAFA